jgi:YD repeat-containing protein
MKGELIVADRRLLLWTIWLLLSTASAPTAAQRCVQHGYLPSDVPESNMALLCQPSTITRITYGGPVGWSFMEWPCGISENEQDMRTCLIDFMSRFRSCYVRTQYEDWTQTTRWGDAGFTPDGDKTLRRDDQLYRTYFKQITFVNGSPTCGSDEYFVLWGMFRQYEAYCPLGKAFYGWDYSDPDTPMVCGDPTPIVPSCTGPNSLFFGNPIDAATGAKHHREIHIQGGPFSVPVEWFYKSDRQHYVSDKPILPVSARGILSFQDRVWRHTYDKRLLVDRTGFRPTVRIIRPDSARDAFFALTPQGWIPSQFGKDSLREVSDGSAAAWFYKSADNVGEAYDANGRLLAIVWPSGKQISLSYSGGLLREARGTFGVPIRFTHSSGQLKSITDAAGRSVTYTFQPVAQTLQTVKFQNGTGRTYLYEERYTHLLTGVIDELANRIGTYTYSTATQRAVGTEGALGSNRFLLTYRENWYGGAGSAVSSVTTPFGGVAAISWAPIGPSTHYWRYSPVAESFAGTESRQAGCENLYRSSRFDGSGNLTEAVDFEGNRTCFAHEAVRSLETQRAEGLGPASSCSTAFSSPPAGARITSTQWHPDWRLETKIAEPNKLTTIVYNGQGATCAPSTVLVDGKPPAVVCSRTEQATTDETGAQGFAATVTGTARTWRYTYTTYGRVVTATDPNGKVTRTTYYLDDDPDLGRRGNVATVTNAAGHVTQYSGYNPHGQVTQMIDPNGLMTDLTYDRRMRLTSRKVGNELTRFTYDLAGQLINVTLPDGAKLTYTYDAAQRLTGIADHKGNKVAYTLDAMGNRINEKMTDPGGVLVRNIARSIDALNRVQQVTGAVQ